jgi:hypothetical protein
MPDPTLKQASEAYLAHLGTLGKKAATVYTYGKDLEVVCGYLGETTKLSALQPARIGKFVKSDALLKNPEGKPRAERTVQKTVRVLRMFLVWAKETGQLEALPLPKDFPMGYSKPGGGEPAADSAAAEAASDSTPAPEAAHAAPRAKKPRASARS